MSCVVVVVVLQHSLQALLPRLFAKSFLHAACLCSMWVAFDDEDIFKQVGISLYKGGGDTKPLNDINFVDESNNTNTSNTQ